jgi:hypothetical protein
MFAERERTQGLRAPAAIGTVRASEVQTPWCARYAKTSPRSWSARGLRG